MKEYLYFSKTDKAGILFLSAIVIVLLFINLSINRLREYRKETRFDNNNTSINSITDSLNALSPTLYSMNDTPNTSLSTLYSVDNSNQKSIDTTSIQSIRKTTQQSSQKREPIIIELNTVDSATLESLPAIGPIFASRIVKYREMLGGYIAKSQLLEVYGLSQETYNFIANQIKVDSTLITKISINEATFKQILHHPYFDYQTTLTIVRARETTPFTSFEDFTTRTGITERKILTYIDM